MIAIRGASTVTEDTAAKIKETAIELINELMKANNLKAEELISIIFSCTQDIKSDYPGKYVREYFGFDKVAIMHFNEMFVENSLEKCIRVMMLVNKDNIDDINYVYLNKAKKLRSDLFKNKVDS